MIIEDKIDNSQVIKTGSVVKFKSVKGINYCLVIEIIKSPAETQYLLANLETGQTYYRVFANHIHIKNHLNKHYGGFEVFPPEKTKLSVWR